jgi:hypothetical protein
VKAELITEFTLSCRVYRITMRKLNRHAGLQEVMGSPLAGEDMLPLLTYSAIRFALLLPFNPDTQQSHCLAAVHWQPSCSPATS